MTDDMQLARARKHSPGYAAYLEARAKLDAETTAPPPVPTGLDALTERRPELAAAAEAIAAVNPGLRVPEAPRAGTRGCRICGGGSEDGMTACEPCWNEAYRQSRLLGGSQVDYYLKLIEVLEHHPHNEPTADPARTQEAAASAAAEGAEA